MVMTNQLNKPFPAPEVDLKQLWYVPDRRLQTKSATNEAIAIADWIRTGQGLPEKPKEESLFVALHTCAYQAAKPAKRKPISQNQRRNWARRWWIIREYLVEKNMGLVYSMMGRFSVHHSDEDDMLSDALLGLSRAVDRFNPWRGFRFSTYACNVIARALMRRGKQENLHRRLFPVQHDISLEQPDRSPDNRMELYAERLNRVLEENLGELTELESRILAERFLRDDDRPRLTFQEIGDAIGLSKERVRQIQNIALSKLRGVLDQDPVLQ